MSPQGPDLGDIVAVREKGKGIEKIEMTEEKTGEIEEIAGIEIEDADQGVEDDALAEESHAEKAAIPLEAPHNGRLAKNGNYRDYGIQPFQPKTSK